MNSVNVIGRLTKDPELNESASGMMYSKFTIAIDDYASKEDRADFIRVVSFGRQAENAKKYLRKGFLVGVNGKIKTDVYEDKDNNKKYSVDVIADRIQFVQWPEKDDKESNPNYENQSKEMKSK